MRRPAIPRSILPHEALLCDVSHDAWQHPIDTPVARLRHVRIDAQLLRRASEEDTTHAARAVLYFDCRSSLPLRASFARGQSVIWQHNGLETRFTVQEVIPVWDDGALHHYELELEGG